MSNERRHAKIFYFCYRHQRPTGGQKHTYRHVDILNEAGFDATIFHPGDDFRLDWFDNHTRVTNFSQFELEFDTDRDYVVLPEDLGVAIDDFPGRKVIFNKNFFYGFRCFGEVVPRTYPYYRDDVVAAFVVSEHNRRHLQFAFPKLRVERVYLEIDPKIFRPRQLNHKKPTIACVLKGVDHLWPIYHTLYARAKAGLNNAELFNWIFLGEKSERETAEILQESLLFLFLSSAEGMGRMPLEAMACGCLIACFDVGPLKEIVPNYARHSHNDLVSIVKFIEEAMSSYPDDLSKWSAEIELGYESARRFSLEHQTVNVVEAWRKIFSLHS